MAFGKISRMDNKRSSSYCTTVTIVIFVALCLVGVWMMTSSTVLPVQNVDIPPSETNSEMKQEVKESRTFEDSSGDASDIASKVDPRTDLNFTKVGQKDIEETKDTVNELARIDETDEQESSKGTEIVKNITKIASESDISNSKDRNGDTSGTEERARKDEANAFNIEDQNNEDENENTSSTEGLNTGKKEASQSQSEALPEEGNQLTNSATGEQEDDSHATDAPKSKVPTATKGINAGAEATNSQIDATENGNDLDVNKQKHRMEDGLEERKSDADSVVDEAEKNAQRANVNKDEETDSEEDSKEKALDGEPGDGASNDVLSAVVQSELLNETTTLNGAFSTQAVESKNEKEAQKASNAVASQSAVYGWQLCNVTAGSDYIPCLDNIKAIKMLRSTKHYEHRERHCPEKSPTCLVPLPDRYRKPIKWPESRNKIWYFNVPHTKLAALKGHQNWVKVSGEFLKFPGGGTQFKNGALHYIDFIQEAVNDIAWGNRSRVVLDVGCGVASFGGYLFDRDVITMSFAPKDEHEAQVQFALERGIPAISAVMGTLRLPFPGMVFDVVHCARCRVPWHIEGGKLLLELNRVLRPGGYFVWSATPVYQKLEEDVQIWKAMSDLTKSMCWKLVTIQKDEVNRVGAAIYQKPFSNDCYDARSVDSPPLCSQSDDRDAAWYVPLQACMHQVPSSELERGAQWPDSWPQRLDKTPYWLNDSQLGVYGRPAPEDFLADYEHWKRVVSKTYLKGIGINWSNVRNVMDMRSVYGGFAAALRNMDLWVMNVVSIDAPDTLPIIYERGLMGMYHDWCESFSTYPRSYDLLHADHLFSRVKKRCMLIPVIVEVDRILRPEGKLIVRDISEVLHEVVEIVKSLQWKVHLSYSKDKEGLLWAQKSFWRPNENKTTDIVAPAA